MRPFIIARCSDCHSCKTGRCLDIETLNKVCKSCSVLASKPDDIRNKASKASHQCSINYTGSVPAMELEGVKRIFSRSESSCSLQYTGYIGDNRCRFTMGLQVEETREVYLA